MVLQAKAAAIGGILRGVAAQQRTAEIVSINRTEQQPAIAKCGDRHATAIIAGRVGHYLTDGRRLRNAGRTGLRCRLSKGGEHEQSSEDHRSF